MDAGSGYGAGLTIGSFKYDIFNVFILKNIIKYLFYTFFKIKK